MILIYYKIYPFDKIKTPDLRLPFYQYLSGDIRKRVSVNADGENLTLEVTFKEIYEYDTSNILKLNDTTKESFIPKNARESLLLTKLNYFLKHTFNKIDNYIRAFIVQEKLLG